MERKRVAVALLCLAVLSTMVLFTTPIEAAAQAATVTLPVTEDAGTSRATPNTNFASGPQIQLSSADRRGFLNLDPIGLLDVTTYASLTSAHLRVHVSTPTPAAGSITLHRSNRFWTESTVTYTCPRDLNLANSTADCSPAWNPNPWPVGPVGTVAYPSGFSGWIEIDITGHVNEVVQGKLPNFGLMIRSTQETTISTSDSSSGPEIRLTYNHVVPSLVAVASDDWNFELSPNGTPWVPRGVNLSRFYAADPPCGALLEDFWATNWQILETDFDDASALGFNTIRIFLHLPAYMNSPTEVNGESLIRLDQLVRMADRKGIRLVLTGLMNTDRGRVPAWFAALTDSAQTSTEANFWTHVAERYPNQPGIFAHDIQNEPTMQPTSQVVSNPLSPTCSASSWVHYHGRNPQAEWNSFVVNKYSTQAALQAAWSDYPRSAESWPSALGYGTASGDEQRFRDWMEFRTEEAHDWLEANVNAVRSVDDTHLITLGRATTPFENEAEHLACRPYGIGSGFTTYAIADLVDFFSPHQYPSSLPSTSGCPTNPPPGSTNIDVLHAEQRSAGVHGLPVVLGEFDSYQIGTAHPGWTTFTDRTLGTVSGWFGQWDGRSEAELIDDGAIFPLGRLQALTTFYGTVPVTGVTRGSAGTTVAISDAAQVRSETARHELMDAWVAFRDAGYLVDLELVP